MRILVLCAFSCLLLAAFSSCKSSDSEGIVWKPAGGVDKIEKELKPPADVTRREGTAVAVLLDTSLSMKNDITGFDGKPAPKIRIARRALLEVLKKMQTFAREHPQPPLVAGIYEFSSRPDLPSCRPVVPLGPPDLTAAHAVAALTPEGSTPIGDAMVQAKRDLDASGMSKLYLVVISDGESNVGYLPGDVAHVIGNLPEENRAFIYFIAFDVDAEIFRRVKEEGGAVFTADDENQLQSALDSILTGAILRDAPARRRRPGEHPFPR